MRKVILVLGLVFVVAVQGMAQDNGHRRGHHKGEKMTAVERMEKHLNKMDEKLDLSDDQKDRIRIILAENHDKMSNIRGEMKETAREDRKAFREELKALREETTDEILTVLNDDQEAKFREMLEKREERARNRMEQRSKRKRNQG